jgi:hypothetical protein
MIGTALVELVKLVKRSYKKSPVRSPGLRSYNSSVLLPGFHHVSASLNKVRLPPLSTMSRRDARLDPNVNQNMI